MNDTAWFFVLPGAGLLEFSDADRLDFLQRQTTNDLRLLAPGRGLTTVVTSPLGRILDVLQLLEAPEAIQAVTLPARAQATYDYFRRRIFFNDRVKVRNASAETCQVLLEGPGAAVLLETAGLPAPTLEQVVQGTLEEVEIKVIGQPGVSGRGYRLLAVADALPRLVESLAKRGASELSPAEYEVLRVEAGLPGAGSELTEEYTPLETRLDFAISHNKGCYTGQEVIARQITYDKVTRLLVGLRLPAPAAPGMRLYAEEKPAGEITSYAFSPRLGHIALGMVRRPYFEPGTLLQGEEGLAAKVVSLPFPT